MSLKNKIYVSLNNRLTDQIRFITYLLVKLKQMKKKQDNKRRLLFTIMMKKKESLMPSSATTTAAAADNSSAIAAPTADDIKLISKMANNEELDIFASNGDEDENDELDKLFAECGF